MRPDSDPSKQNRCLEFMDHVARDDDEDDDDYDDYDEYVCLL